jgi:fatty-acyl-CoA synthase
MEVALTPLAFLDRARDLFPSRVGVVDGALRLDYAAFAARVDRLAHALIAELGVAPGDRVAWLCGNTHELLEAYFGVLRAGAVLVPLNIRLARAELEAIVADCTPAVVVRHPDEHDLDVPPPVVTLGPAYEALLARQPSGPPPARQIDERAPAEIFYTSGTTGLPKGAVLTHRNLYLHAVHSALTNGIDGTDVILHTIPLFHVNGWGTPHYVTALGGVHVMLPRFDAGEVLRLVDAERVTRLFLVPTMASRLLDHPDLDRRDLSSLRQISVGGAPTPPTTLAELEDRLGCPCICGYGMTEASPTITRSLDKPGEPPRRARRATTGLPIVGVEVSVVDGEGAEVPRDGATPGEIRTRSNHVMAGYWNDPEATAAVIRDGWLHTGDVAVVDPDGYLTIIDRTKDVIVSGGENVSSVEVEKALAAHPAVSEAAVIGMADPEWGEVPEAFVTLRPGAVADPDDLITWARGRLAAFKAPRRVSVVADLPRSGTGKIRKAELRSDR